MGASTHKGTYGITLQKDYEYFLVFFSFFHMKEFLDEIFCNLLLKIHIFVTKSEEHPECFQAPCLTPPLEDPVRPFRGTVCLLFP
jgi:hypothetical protein